ncbi:cytochrome c maturation protein CcmE [Nocardioides terrisoli]|uniref:cytochrome c maturation protein CcmE n=1 Tax=Nocardioides terrisoli TaxID=3388267 RepID=UPI00287B5BD8|nr:cytochrome c maturation protein CcmE [Nocardioides marmorisolisilvae]
MRRRRRLPLLVVVIAVLAAAGLLSAAAMQGTFDYYRTPSELDANAVSSQQSVRLGGMVEPGSVHHHGAEVRFVLTDGAHDVVVVSHGTPPSTFRGGQGAVVIGHYIDGKVFRADSVEVRHSNQYRAAGDSG